MRMNAYPAALSLTGAEILVIVSSDGTQTLTTTASAVAGAPANSPSTPGAFYAAQGARIGRINDRLFVGGATDCDGSNAPAQDWLSALMGPKSTGPWALRSARTASLSRFGETAIVGASHTYSETANDAVLGFVPSSIGVAAWGVADDTTNPTTATAYAFYGEAWRMQDVVYQPTFGMELECVNFGGVPVGESTPFHPNNGGGTYGIQLGAGGGQTSGTSDAEAGIVFVSNPNAFRTGIIFSAGSLTGDADGGAGGAGVAISMAPGHILEWVTPETVDNVQGANAGFTFQSQVTEAAQGMRLIAVNGSTSFTNSAGHSVFSVQTNTSPDNTITIEAGTGGQAPGIYANGSGTNNLGLFPGTGGEIVTQGPTVGGGAMPASASVFLHINVNGSDLRLPLFTPSQVGG